MYFQRGGRGDGASEPNSEILSNIIKMAKHPKKLKKITVVIPTLNEYYSSISCSMNKEAEGCFFR